MKLTTACKATELLIEGLDESKLEFGGLEIKHCSVGSSLELVFKDGRHLRLADEMRSCCENRHMTCDDELTFMRGAKLLWIEEKPVQDLSKPGEYEKHEAVFIEVVTDRGAITLCTHNEHNGYYGGFDLQLRWV
jgi:hypothetical protein